jgi:hypothetical protein
MNGPIQVNKGVETSRIQTNEQKKQSGERLDRWKDRTGDEEGGGGHAIYGAVFCNTVGFTATHNMEYF